MKYLKFIFSGTIILTLVIGLFVPLISINNQYFSLVLLVFSSNCCIYSLIIFVSFLLGICSAILILFKEKHTSFIYSSLILSITSGLVVLFSKDVLMGALEEGQLISDTPTPYIVGGLTLLFSLSTCQYVFKVNQFSIRDIVEIAMLIGLAIILDLDFLKIRIVANGGSISFVMVPLIILALRQGFVKGFIGCGLIFGLITCLLDGYGIFTFPFDYLLGFGALAVIGLFNKIILPNNSKKITIKGILFLIVSILIGGSLRLLSSTISGVLFYETTFIESLVYQCLYIPFSVLASLGLVLLLYKPLLLINTLFPINHFR